MNVAGILNSIAKANPVKEGPYVVRCEMRNGSTLYLRQEGTSIQFVARHQATACQSYDKADAWMRVAQWNRAVLYALPEPQ